jgi:hypothetical protein
MKEGVRFAELSMGFLFSTAFRSALELAQPV